MVVVLEASGSVARVAASHKTVDAYRLEIIDSPLTHSYRLTEGRLIRWRMSHIEVCDYSYSSGAGVPFPVTLDQMLSTIANAAIANTQAST